MKFGLNPDRVDKTLGQNFDTFKESTNPTISKLDSIIEFIKRYILPCIFYPKPKSLDNRVGHNQSPHKQSTPESDPKNTNFTSPGTEKSNKVDTNSSSPKTEDPNHDYRVASRKKKPKPKKTKKVSNPESKPQQPNSENNYPISTANGETVNKLIQNLFGSTDGSSLYFTGTKTN